MLSQKGKEAQRRKRSWYWFYSEAQPRSSGLSLRRNSLYISPLGVHTKQIQTQNSRHIGKGQVWVGLESLV
jgi:hypothetical protein